MRPAPAFLFRLFATPALLILSVALHAAPPPAEPPMDFSTAGYGGGGVALPNVPARYTIAPTGGDDTRLIQAAIDAVAQLPLDANGFRGAVALQPATYRVAGQLRINASGVVLRGNKTTLIATGQSRRTLIEVQGTADRKLDAGIQVTDTVPAGARTLTLASVDGLAAGRRVLVQRPCTQEWITALGMNLFTGNYKEMRLDWIPGSRDIEWERTIVSVDATAHTITIDAPITTALEAKFGGGTVRTFSWPGRISHVGVEGLTCVSEVDAKFPLDEEHAWFGVSVDRAENAWVRDVTTQHFVSACVWVGRQARAVTVQDCAALQPVAESASWRRLGFYVGGQQVLVQRCVSEDGRHDFAAGLCSAGPNVFLECTATRAKVDIGPFESWSSGALYDHLTVSGAGIAFRNIGPLTQGAGWTSANNLIWNCAAASLFKMDDPPGATNRAMVSATIPSLYRSQLAARLGEPALATLAPSELPPGMTGVMALTAAELPALPAKAERPLSIEHGYLVVGGRAVFGGSTNSALWKGQLVPGREREVGTSPTRWAPGRHGPSLTENLDELTDKMIAQQSPIYWAFPGLWYDRRREEHLVTRRDDGEVYGPFFESPWRRSGQGQAWDGLSKYDLTQYNPWYFSRMREMADDCAAKGLVFACQVYCNHNVEEASAHFAEYAWRSANNINDSGFPEPPPWEGAMQNRIHIADQFYDVTNPVRRPLHEAYIRHTLDVLADSPNLIVTVGYQFAGPLPFQQFFIDTVTDWEKAHGGRHVRIVLQTSKAVTDAILADPVRAAQIDVIDTRYWQYLTDGTLFAPDGQAKLAFRELRTNQFGRDAGIPTKAEFVYKQVREYRDKFPDKAVIAAPGGFGPIPILLAGGASYAGAEGQLASDGGAHDDKALVQFISTHVADALPHLRPADGVVADAWCLADEGRHWLIYSPAGDAIKFMQPISAKGATGTWFNPRNGETQAAKLDGGAILSKPTSEAWLLWVGNKP